jgi:hypothetical protein
MRSRAPFIRPRMPRLFNETVKRVLGSGCVVLRPCAINVAIEFPIDSSGMLP